MPDTKLRSNIDIYDFAAYMKSVAPEYRTMTATEILDDAKKKMPELNNVVFYHKQRPDVWDAIKTNWKETSYHLMGQSAWTAVKKVAVDFIKDTPLSDDDMDQVLLRSVRESADEWVRLKKEHDQKINSDPELLGYRAWYEDNPFEFSVEKMTSSPYIGRAVGNLMTSYAPMIAASFLPPPVGIPLTLAIGFTLESGDAMQSAYETLKQQGYNDRDAVLKASGSVVAYAAMATVLESAVPFATGRLLKAGLSTTANKKLISAFAAKFAKNATQLTGEVTEKAATDFAVKTMGEFISENASIGKVIGRALKISAIESFGEGTTEAVQQITQNAILEHNLKGTEIDEKWVLNQLQEPDVQESFYAGALGGQAMGTLAGFASKGRNLGKSVTEYATGESQRLLKKETPLTKLHTKVMSTLKELGVDEETGSKLLKTEVVQDFINRTMKDKHYSNFEKAMFLKELDKNGLLDKEKTYIDFSAEEEVSTPSLETPINETEPTGVERSKLEVSDENEKEKVTDLSDALNTNIPGSAVEKAATGIFSSPQRAIEILESDGTDPETKHKLAQLAGLAINSLNITIHGKQLHVTPDENGVYNTDEIVGAIKGVLKYGGSDVAENISKELAIRQSQIGFEQQVDISPTFEITERDLIQSQEDQLREFLDNPAKLAQMDIEHIFDTEDMIDQEIKEHIRKLSEPPSPEELAEMAEKEMVKKLIEKDKFDNKILNGSIDFIEDDDGLYVQIDDYKTKLTKKERKLYNDNLKLPEKRKNTRMKILEDEVRRRIIKNPDIGTIDTTLDDFEGEGTPEEQSSREQAVSGLKSDSETIVHAGKGQNVILSNFAEAPFEFRGKKYKTAEGAYQAWKSGKEESGYENLTGFEAKKAGYGKSVNKASNISLMREILKAKYEQVPEFRKALNEAGKIVHPVKDKFWSAKFPELLEELKVSGEKAQGKRESTSGNVVETQKFIKRSDLKRNPDTIYLFGDNLEQRGMGGQAKEMRGEPNAIGIPTKKKPSNSKNSFFTDDEFEQNKKVIDEAFAKIPDGKKIIIPEDGLGTGLASLETKAPKTFAYLQSKLNELSNKKKLLRKHFSSFDEPILLGSLEKAKKANIRDIKSVGEIEPIYLAAKKTKMSIEAWMKIYAPSVITNPGLYKSPTGDILITENGKAVGEIRSDPSAKGFRTQSLILHIEKQPPFIVHNVVSINNASTQIFKYNIPLPEKVMTLEESLYKKTGTDQFREKVTIQTEKLKNKTADELSAILNNAQINNHARYVAAAILLSDKLQGIETSDVPAESITEDITKLEGAVRIFDEGYKIELVDTIKNDKNIGANVNHDKKTIYISREVLKKKFDEKAWTKPNVKGVIPLKEDAFATQEEFNNFVLYHEAAHIILGADSEYSDLTKVQRENKANEVALKEMGLNPADYLNKEVLNVKRVKVGKDVKSTRLQASEEFQEIPITPKGENIGTEKKPLISASKELHEAITKRLKETYPSITGRAIDYVYKTVTGEAVKGKSFVDGLEMVAEWSRTQGTIDTAPHEYAHHYINMMADSKVVRLGVKRFGSVEKLVQHVGEYYAGRMANGKTKNSLVIWLKHFWNAVKSFFGGKNAIGDIIGEAFYEGKNLVPEQTVKEIQGTGFTITRKNGSLYFKPEIKRVNTEVFHHIVEHYSEVETQFTDENGQRDYDTEKLIDFQGGPSAGVMFNNVFFDFFGDYVTNATAVEISKLAAESVPYEGNVSIDDIVVAFKKKLAEYNRKYGIGANLDNALDSIREKQYQRYRKEFPDHIAEKMAEKYAIEFINNRLKTFILKAASSIPNTAFDETGWGRTRWILQSVRGVPEFAFEDVTHVLRNKVKTSGTFPINLFELAAKNRTDIIIHYLPASNVVDYIEYPDKKTGETKWFLKPKDIVLDMGHIMGMLKSFNDEYMGYSLEDKKKFMLMTLFHGKSGDHRTLMLVPVPKKFKGKVGDKKYTPYSYKELKGYLQAEVDAGLMPEKDMNKMLAEGKKYEKTIPTIYSQIITRHITWQKIKGSDYLIRSQKKDRAQDYTDRLRNDFQEGLYAFGMGNSKLIAFHPEEVIIKHRDSNGELTDIPATDIDGTLWTSGNWFRRASETIGIDVNGLAKTGIRANNEHGYIIVKHMQQRAFNGMEFWKKGAKFPFAKAIGKGTHQRIALLDKEGNQMGEVDMIGGIGMEVKDSSGQYSKPYTTHEVSDKEIVFMQIPKGVKKNAPHPVLAHELALSTTMEPAVEDYIEAVMKHYEIVAKQYIDKLYSFVTDTEEGPKNLKEFLLREVEENRVMDELQILARISKSGKLLYHPAVFKKLIPMLANKFIIDTMFKARVDNQGSRLYLKPQLAMGLKNNEIALSSDNSVLLEVIKQDMIREKGAKKWWVEPGHETIITVNNWLKNNDKYVLMHRVPLQKWGGAVPVKLVQFIEGGHGQSIFMNNEMIFDTLDADTDGDTAFVENIDDTSQLIDKYRRAIQTDQFENNNKPLRLDAFQHGNKDSTPVSLEDSVEAMYDIQIGNKAIGMVINVSAMIANANYKEFMARPSIPYKNGDDETVWFKIRSLDEVSVMDKLPLDKEMDAELYDTLVGYGDKMVTFENGEKKYIESREELKNSKGDVFFEVSLRRELQYLKQLTLDNRHYGLLKELGFGWKYILTKMFEREDGKPLNKFDEKFIGALYHTFNYSALRRGDSINRGKLSMGSILDITKDISKIFYEDGKLIEDVDKVNDGLKNRINKIIMLKNKKAKGITAYVGGRKITGIKVGEIKTNGKISPLEVLLSQLGNRQRELEANEEAYIHNSPNPFVPNITFHKAAHHQAMLKFEKAFGKKYLDIVDAASRGNKVAKQKLKSLGVAVHLMDQMAKEFDELNGKRREALNIASEDEELMMSVKAEYDPEYIDFVEKYYPLWKKLNKEQKEYATYRFLTGTPWKNQKGRSTKVASRTVLLPVWLMDHDILNMYGDIRYNEIGKLDNDAKAPMTNETLYSFGFKQAKQSVESAEISEILGVCQ